MTVIKAGRPHYALLAYAGTAITLPSGGSASSLTNLPMDTNQGSHGITVTLANERPIAIVRTGIYHVSFAFTMTLGTDDLLAVYVTKNGATSGDAIEAGVHRMVNAELGVVTFAKTFYASLTAGDTLGLYAYQDGASNRSTLTGVGNRPVLQIAEVR